MCRLCRFCRQPAARVSTHSGIGFRCPDTKRGKGNKTPLASEIFWSESRRNWPKSTTFGRKDETVQSCFRLDRNKVTGCQTGLLTYLAVAGRLLRADGRMELHAKGRRNPEEHTSACVASHACGVPADGETSPSAAGNLFASRNVCAAMLASGSTALRASTRLRPALQATVSDNCALFIHGCN